MRVHHLEQNAREREAKAHAIFTDFCTREPLPLVAEPQNADIGPSAQWHVESDQEPRLLAVYGMNADLIVASRGTQGDDGSARFALNTLLMGSGRPVLIPGGPAVPSNLSARIVIAWKPTPQAARAVAFAMPFISRAKEVVVLTIDEQEEGIPEASRLAAYLAWHGVQATTQRLQPSAAGAAATALAAADKASLLVMGGYGRARLSEWAFGGFTRSILREAPLPVLMAH